MKNPLFRHIANRLLAFNNCQAMSPQNTEWADKHAKAIDALVEEFMPSGSGIDSGCEFDWNASEPNKLVFTTSYHHMNDGGYYDGWTEHKVIVTPSLTSEYDLKITGRDRNEIKDYLTEVFHSALSDVIESTAEGYVSLARAESVRRYKDGIAKGEIV